MKLLSQTFGKNSSGSITLVCEDKEDLWTTYNLLAKNDELTLRTDRNIKKSPTSSKSVRKNLLLKLKVETVDFTPSDDVMRVKGRTIDENEDVPMGSYHTAQIQFNLKFTIYKDEWDEIALDMITKACSIEEKAEVGAVVLEEGVAHICLLTENMTVIVLKIEKSIPKKRRGDSSAYEKAMSKFIDMTANSTIKHLNYEKLQAILLVSPGSVAKQLYDKIFQIATVENKKDLLVTNKSKFITSHSSTGYLQGLEEALKTPELQKRLGDTKFQKNINAFDEFTRLLNEDQGKAWYGEEEIVKAIEIGGAVKTLLITDKLFKSDDINKRKFYIELTEKVKKFGGEVMIFSSLHDSGEQLNQLTGIACILNYPIPDLDESDSEEEEDDDDDEKT